MSRIPRLNRGRRMLEIRSALFNARCVRVAEFAHLLYPDPESSHVREVPTTARRAAVAIILHETSEEELEVLLMRRVARDGDPWSGQISLPGGMEDETDSDLWATAIRETEEEVGCRLAEIAERIGAVESRPAMSRGKVLPTEIYPVVFQVEARPLLTLGPEAARAFWLPLGRAASGELDRPFVYDRSPTPVTLPSWHYEGETIWGLTFGILRSLLALGGVAHAEAGE